MTESLMVAGLLVQIRDADGSDDGHWIAARVAQVLANRILTKHQNDSHLPSDLLQAIQMARAALATDAANGFDWAAARRQALRVLPVVIRVQEAIAVPPGTSGSA